MTVSELIDAISQDLGANFNTIDMMVLSAITNDVVSEALFISNRSDFSVMTPEIKKCVKAIYLQRGVEDVTNKSESGMNATYTNAMENLRNEIVTHGKRVFG